MTGGSTSNNLMVALMLSESRSKLKIDQKYKILRRNAECSAAYHRRSEVFKAYRHRKKKIRNYLQIEKVEVKNT